MFEPMIAEAARQRADLAVLGETLTYPGVGKKSPEVAEADPGPSTDYFGQLARQHDLYIVASLLEQDGALVYDVAALIGPGGKLVGKYRKYCLPRGEVKGGITPDLDYPVLTTRFGQVGLMVCYEGVFPGGCPRVDQRGGPRSLPGPSGAAIHFWPAPEPARTRSTSSAAPMRRSPALGWSRPCSTIRTS